MNRYDERGAINVLTIPLALAVILFVAAAGFGAWAFMSRQDYKTQSDQKVAAAVDAAKKATADAKDKQFANDAKYPLKTYVGPVNYGSIHIAYPKTWSAYVDESDRGDTLVDDYFHPDAVSATDTAYALRFQVLQSSYTDQLKDFDGLVEQSKVTINPYRAPKVPSVLGSRINGEIEDGIKGSVVILPLRDKTLKIWTESPNYLKDFNNDVLANLTFLP